MMVFSTFLEIDGTSILYLVYRNRQLAFFNPSGTREAPILFATYDHAWQIKGTNDERLVSQALREISN